MSDGRREHQRARERSHSGDAPDAAAAAAFLDMADRLGVLDLLVSGRSFRPSEIAARADLAPEAAHRYVAALVAAGLVEEDPLVAGSCRPVPAFPVIAHRAGYVSWAMSANRVLIDDVRDVLSDPHAFRQRRPSGPDRAATTMDLMAWLALNPSVVNVMLAVRATKVVDLHARTGRLLVDALVRLPGCVGTGLVTTTALRGLACAAARTAGVQDRLTILERPIRSLLDDPSLVSGSDVLHAGAAFHELLPDRHLLRLVLKACRKQLRIGGVLMLTELVPPPHPEQERLFGALATLYSELQGHHLLTESEWVDELRKAGFANVAVRPVGLPATRLITASA